MTNDDSQKAARPGKADSIESEDKLLERNPSFCMAAWMHLHVQAEGYVTPCCESRQRLGDINRTKFLDIWHGAEMSQVRARMLRGERIEGCRKCYEKEAVGIESLRRQYNEKNRHLFGMVATSRSDGSAPDARPVHWDIRFSNICNFRCRSCWHGSSSRWFADGTALGVTAANQAIIHGVEDADSLFVQLDAVMPELEHIYFAGGEPLIMEEHYRLLDRLVERGCFGVTLSYNTNLSVTSYKGRDVLELWNRFPKVEVLASVDAAGARGELMRKEQSWAQFLANARRIRAESPHVRLRTDTTVSILNLLHLPDLFRELVTHEVAPIGGMLMHLLQEPRFYNIRVLPPAWKKKARARLREFEDWLERVLAQAQDRDQALAFQRAQIGDILSYMEAEDWSKLLPRFRDMTARVDGLREEKTSEAFPELAPLLATTSNESPWRKLRSLVLK